MLPNNIIEIRKKNAAESILGNESLTADLDDQSANALLEWGLDCVNRIVDATANMDDQSANLFIDETIPSVRRLMRNVNNWLSEITTDQSSIITANFEKALQNASLIYGSDYRPPDQIDIQMFTQCVQEKCTEQEKIISSFREMIEARLKFESTI